MNIEDIKVGETYNVRMKFANIDEDGNYCFNMETKQYVYRLFNKTDVETCVFPMPDPANGTKNTDPCRKFREGDSVRPVERYGRQPDDGAPVNVICEVVEDERKNGTVAIRARGACGAVQFRVTALYLQLITPVEELEPYRVVRPENYQCIRIMKGKRIHSSIPFDEEECVCRTLEEAKAAAEAERDRLNAEHRKGMKK